MHNDSCNVASLYYNAFYPYNFKKSLFHVVKMHIYSCNVASPYYNAFYNYHFKDGCMCECKSSVNHSVKKNNSCISDELSCYGVNVQKLYI